VNVRDADATVVLARHALGGTALTVRLAAVAGLPLLVVDLDASPDPGTVAAWLADRAVAVLNVAGPRESENPGIAGQAGEFLRAVFCALGPPPLGSGGAAKLRLDDGGTCP
jgi:hypothetical protein